jgi:hypothetical protein
VPPWKRSWASTSEYSSAEAPPRRTFEHLWSGWVRYVRLWGAHVSPTVFDRWRVTRLGAGAGALPGHQPRGR